ncbi:F-box/LRR-repeat protein 4-like [Monomorium pharaonis]|uniref:F-box/LRR-repeat protein 4-like n=1 Tax=Monomorium pharaonis TaxID=307658 RepID=UPI001747A13B|nr:F-box/LRR-repeat protein 4-like [Monomorium pharaonis]
MFINTCGKHLTHLNLCCCRYVDDSALLQISKTCEILKELDLSNCHLVNDKGFSYLENLKYLERLHLQELRSIQTKTLCKILQRNQQLRDLNLAYTDLNIDEVTVELKNSCPNLETINLKLAKITSKSIYALADCKNLREIDFGWVSMEMEENQEDLEKSFHILFSSLRLEKLDITDIMLTYSILESLIMMCKNLKSLTSQGCTVKSDSNIFQRPKLVGNRRNYYYKWRLNDSLFILWDYMSRSASFIENQE